MGEEDAIAPAVERECIAPLAVNKKLAGREVWADDAREDRDRRLRAGRAIKRLRPA
jgi:hypothetical protein